MCALFTAFTGASGMTIVAVGALLYPALQQAGYRERFNLGLITTSGSLGLLFPPSLPLILSVTSPAASVDDLFVAGILPGLLMLILLSAFSLREGLRLERRPGARFRIREARPRCARRCGSSRCRCWSWAGSTAGCSRSGGGGGDRRLRPGGRSPRLPRGLPPSAAGGDAGVDGHGRRILIILGCSLASTNYLMDAQVPEKLLDFVTRVRRHPIDFLLLLNVFLLVLGLPARHLLRPGHRRSLILPIATTFGIDPIHLGIVFLANLQIGYCTPPVGMNLFIASYRFKQPVVTLYRATLPFLVVLMLTVLLITYWPWLTLVLVR